MFGDWFQLAMFMAKSITKRKGNTFFNFNFVKKFKLNNAPVFNKRSEYMFILWMEQN